MERQHMSSGNQSENEPCQRCGGVVVWVSKPLSRKRLRKAYHFEKWLKCLRCKTRYLDESFKVLHDTVRA